MLCNMINGRCTHCGGAFGGRCKLSKDPNTRQGLGDLTERLLKSVGVTQDRWAAVKERFGYAPTCACEARKEWLNQVSKSFLGK